MKGISRRTAIGGGAAFAGTMTASAASVWVTTPTPAFGPGPGAARRRRPAVVPLRARRRRGEAVRRRLGQGGHGRPVPGLRDARRRADAARPRRAPRAPLARQCRRVGLCHRRPLPGHHHRPRQPLRDRRLRPRRRLVFSARPRPFDPGHRRQALPVPAGLRQRLLLRVRHLLDQRLGRPRARRGAGEEFRRPGRGVRQLPEEGGLHLERARCRRRSPPIRRRGRCCRAPSPIATASTPSSRTSSPAAR